MVGDLFVEYCDSRIKTPMLLWLISDCKKALDAGAYIAALCIALMLPDVCDKANGSCKPKEIGMRYKQWVSEYFKTYANTSYDDFNPSVPYPCVGDTEVYGLRCALLHEGRPKKNVSGTNITFVIDDNPYCERNGESYGTTYSRNKNGELVIHRQNARINLRNFCIYMCDVAEQYYYDNQEYFDSQQSEIVDFSKFGICTEETTPQDITEAIRTLYESNLGGNS